jgi:multiple sugar transport system permease protein
VAVKAPQLSRVKGVGLERALPYLFLAPALILVLAVIAYPLIRGVQISSDFYRFGRPLRSVGLDNYREALHDKVFRSAVWTTIKFVFFAVLIETVLGYALALLCLRELKFIRAVRLILIVPMIVTPVIVGLVFRLIYASDVGLLTIISHRLGGSEIGLLSGEHSAFWAIVALDVWEWTPLMFLILLAGLQSLPQEPFEAAKVDGAGSVRTFLDHTLPLMRQVLAVAIVLRTLDAFTTFDQIYVLTQGGPGTTTQLIAYYGYDAFFRFQRYGFAAAMLIMAALVLLAFSAIAVRMLRRMEAR